MKLRMFAVVFCLLFTAFLVTEFDVKIEEKSKIAFNEEYKLDNNINNKSSIASKFEPNYSKVNKTIGD